MSFEIIIYYYHYTNAPFTTPKNGPFQISYCLSSSHISNVKLSFSKHVSCLYFWSVLKYIFILYSDVLCLCLIRSHSYKPVLVRHDTYIPVIFVVNTRLNIYSSLFGRFVFSLVNMCLSIHLSLFDKFFIVCPFLDLYKMNRVISFHWLQDFR